MQIWNNVNRRYSAVNTNELKDLANKHRRSEIDNLEANFAECEAFNKKFNDDLEFNNKKNAIINRLFERRKQGQFARQPKSKCFFFQLNTVVFFIL